MITATDIRVILGKTTAVNGVCLTVPDAGTLGLVGPNGSGKTTLLRALYGAVPLTTGEVRINDENLRQLSRRRIAQLVAVVAQERDDSDAGMSLSVGQLAMLGRLPHRGPTGGQGTADHQITVKALDDVAMLPLARTPVSSLSGGQHQRALIARALAQCTPHILLDEPTNHLDVRHQHDILAMISGLSGSVVVLHDLNLAARYCDRIVILDEGRIVAEGTPDEVLVPEILEPVYRIPVRRVEVDGDITLVFPRINSRLKSRVHH